MDNITVYIPGHGHLTGKPKQIVSVMNEAQYFDHQQDADSYMTQAVANIERLYGHRIAVTGDTTEERAESFLNGLYAVKLISIRK